MWNIDSVAPELLILWCVIIYCIWCLWISVVPMKFANMELLTSSCTIPSPWRKAWNDTDNRMDFNSMLLMSTDSVPSEEHYWIDVLQLTVTWPPPAVPLLRTGFLAHSLPQKADACSQSRWEKTERINSGTVEYILSKTLVVCSVLLWCALKALGIWRQENETENITNLLNDQLRFCKSLFRLWQLCPLLMWCRLNQLNQRKDNRICRPHHQLS